MSEEEKVDNTGSIQNETAEAKEELFDLLIPPGVPRKIISDILKQFDVTLIERKQRLHFANMDGDERELLAFRGTREAVEKAQDFMFAELKKFIEEG
ncbi:MAG: hypothetical protein A4E38_00995 [Methanoregulaceae archaeon PtaB.Bin108]|nr:MAG: hypothetical protein A4E38_00995 [Methanoregulaceae archaeon PtaB.Bin108]OPY41768.1 MAG: hypothetical protein A4E42_01729 [Methanoregulaceae archaeon PtaU1.Bin222]